jgi:hypothetical protein
MQLLTGDITPETRNDLAPGTVFRVVKDTQYSGLETRVVLVNGSFYLNLDTPEETLWYEITTMKVGATYSPSLENKTLKSTDEFFDNMQHVEIEEVLGEFARQSTLAASECKNAQQSVLNAELRHMTFALLADRIGAII